MHQDHKKMVGLGNVYKLTFTEEGDLTLYSYK